MKRTSESSLERFSVFGLAAVLTASVLAGAPADSQAQGAQGGSIVIQAVDAQGMLVPAGKFYNGQSVQLVAHAFDAAGNSVPCTPTFAPRNSGDADKLTIAGNGVMTMSNTAFGSAEVVATCAQMPGVTSTPMYTSVMAQGTNLGTPNAGLGLRRGPMQSTGAGAAAGGGKHVGLAIGLGLGVAAVVAGAAYALSSGTSSGGSGGSSCATYSDYCPSGAGNGGGVRQSGCSCPGGTTTATCGSSNGNCGGLYPAGTVLCNC